MIESLNEPFNTVSFFISRAAGTYGDVGRTGPHHFLTNNLTLFQLRSGWQIMPTTKACPHQHILHSGGPEQ